MFGATIVADTVARGAPQIFVALGGMTILIRGQRPGEAPVAARPIRRYADFSSHDGWGTDHFGFMYEGDLAAFCDELRGKGAKVVREPGPMQHGGSEIAFIEDPDGYKIELIQLRGRSD